MTTLTPAQQAFFQRLSNQWGGADSFVELSSTEAFIQTKDTDAVGWRTYLPADFLGKDRTLNIVISGRFPAEIPQLWVKPNPFLEWPHSESDGKLCLWPPEQAPVWLSSSELADELIHLLRRLIKMVQSGADTRLREAEFASEWLSYWRTVKKPHVEAWGTVLLLDPPEKEPETYHAQIISAEAVDTAGMSQMSRCFIVAGKKSTDVDRWISHSRLPCACKESVTVLLVPLHSVPTTPGAPTTLPRAKKFIRKWAKNYKMALKNLGFILADTSSMGRWIVFSHGDSALAGLQFVPSKATSKAKGHQNPKTRKHDEDSRKRVGFNVDVVNVQRADIEWIQERGMNARTRPLTASCVTVIGCGSLGSMVTENLALAGIGNLTLIDPGALETANLGRHALGMAAVGSPKVVAMRTRLLSDYPHIEVSAVDKHVQSDDTVIRNNIETADLVICTTADPGCEAYLMARLKSSGIRSLMIAWSEPHALAGHSAHSPGEEYALESLFAEGRSLYPATKFSESPTMPLPGCGESHVPGAGNRIRLIACTVVEHALDVLLGTGGTGEHWTWIAANETIKAHGGERLLLLEHGPAATVVRMIPNTAEHKDAPRAV